VELDAHRSMARLAMGMLRRLQNRLTFSRVELETAIALDRNNALAFRQLGQTKMFPDRTRTPWITLRPTLGALAAIESLTVHEPSWEPCRSW